MTKTIKIAAILLAALAVTALVLSVVLGIRPDLAKKTILAKPGIVEELKKSAAGTPTQTKTSPLVAQAQAIAKRIDPPPPPKPVGDANATDKGMAGGRKLPPPPPAAFDVIATAVNPKDPSRSYALLSQPGKGVFWVKPGDEVNRAVIKSILSGKIVTADGREYLVPQTQRISLLKPGSSMPQGYGKGVSAAPTATASRASEVQPPTATVAAATAKGVAERPAAAQQPVAEQPTAREDTKAAADLLRQMMTDPEKLGLTKEEVAQLGDLGQMLHDVNNPEPQGSGSTNENGGPQE